MRYERSYYANELRIGEIVASTKIESLIRGSNGDRNTYRAVRRELLFYEEKLQEIFQEPMTRELSDYLIGETISTAEELEEANEWCSYPGLRTARRIRKLLSHRKVTILGKLAAKVKEED